MKTYTYTRIVLINNLSNETIIDAIKKINEFFSIPRIRFTDESFEAEFVYDFNKLMALIEEYKEYRAIKVIMKDDIEIFFGRKDGFVYLLERDDSIRKIIFSLVDLKWAYTHDYIDHNLQTDDDPEIWKANNVKISDEVNLFPDPLDWKNKGKLKINTETLPGHEHRMWGPGDGLWFGSFWEMYFSSVYYKYIPRPLWDTFSDCSENLLLDNGIRKIKLYDCPDSYNEKLNRGRQWSFRKQLGIDSIAHEITNERFKINSIDLPVLITKQNCEIGSTRVTRFLDINERLVSESRAYFMEITEYNDNGIEPLFVKKIKI